jgi:porin
MFFTDIKYRYLVNFYWQVNEFTTKNIGKFFMVYYIKTIYAILTNCVIFAVLVISTIGNQALAAEDELPDWQEDTLTGNWGGARAELYKKGIDLGFTHKSDFLANTSGGLKHGTAWLGHTEVRLGLDLDKLWGWDGTSAFFLYHSDLGSKFNKHYVGSFAGVDNIEVGTNTTQFYQAWLQKNFLDDHISALVGLYAVDTEFYVTDTAGLFIQPPYGVGTDFAQAGENGPPVFPLGALAGRLKLTSPTNSFYLQAAVTDGVPGNMDNPRGTHIRLGGGEGTLSIVELGYTPQYEGDSKQSAEIFNKTAIGFWRYSAQFDAIDGAPARHHNQGVYAMAERTLYLEPSQLTQGLAGFVRFGVASESVNQADWTSSLGLRYHGLITGRDDDIAGLGLTVNHAGDRYRRANDSKRYETDVEATYRIQATPYFAVQPTVQLIINPGMDLTIKNAWIVGSRFEVEF